MSTDPLNKLIEKRRKLDAQIREKRARIRAQQNKQKRKDDTRRKIITGALALEHASQHPDSPFAAELLRLMKQHVSDNDRHLFEFPELDTQDSPDVSSGNDNENPWIASMRRAFRG